MSEMSVIIRNAKSEDYEAVRRIMDQVQALHIEWRPDIYRNNEEFFPVSTFEASIQSGNFYVAELDGNVVGVMEIMFRHIESPAHVTRDIVFIDTMAVDEEYRGKGIGHQFFEKIKKLKEERNLDGIELQVNAKNKAAYEMYKKCGFTEKSINMELL